MFKSDNRKIVIDGARLTFVAPATGNRFEIVVRFVGHGEVRGAAVNLAEGATWPEGALFHDEAGAAVTLQREVPTLVAKGATCSITDADGSNHGLFRVDLVDPGRMTVAHRPDDPGGVLYFHSTPAIPPELDGEGQLVDDPTRHLE
jgi:hypothetical protein